MAKFIRTTTWILACLSFIGSFILASELSSGEDGITFFTAFFTSLIGIIMFLMVFLGFAKLIENSDNISEKTDEISEDLYKLKREVKFLCDLAENNPENKEVKAKRFHDNDDDDVSEVFCSVCGVQGTRGEPCYNCQISNIVDKFDETSAVVFCDKCGKQCSPDEPCHSCNKKTKFRRF